MLHIVLKRETPFCVCGIVSTCVSEGEVFGLCIKLMYHIQEFESTDLPSYCWNTGCLKDVWFFWGRTKEASRLSSIQEIKNEAFLITVWWQLPHIHPHNLTARLLSFCSLSLKEDRRRANSRINPPLRCLFHLCLSFPRSRPLWCG